MLVLLSESFSIPYLYFYFSINETQIIVFFLHKITKTQFERVKI